MSNEISFGKTASKEFQSKVLKLRNKCIKTLTNGLYKELQKEYGKVDQLQYIASLYSIYIQFSCGLLQNIDESLKKMFSKEKVKA